MGIQNIELFEANIRTGPEKQLVQLQLTLMAEATSSNNSFIATLAVEKYFAAKLQLVCCKIYITST